MAKAILTVDGFEEIEQGLRDLGALAPRAAASAIRIALEPVEQRMKANAVSMFNKGYSKGTMVRSISTNVDIRDGWVGASVGVFDMGKRVGDYGMVSGRRVTAPMIAMFYETGIQGHFTVAGTRPDKRGTPGDPRGRKAKFSEQYFEFNAKRKDMGRGEMSQHPGSPPIPFLSSAWDSLAPQVFDTIEDELNKAILAIL